jgi:hypothetical protein
VLDIGTGECEYDCEPFGCVSRAAVLGAVARLPRLRKLLLDTDTCLVNTSESSESSGEQQEGAPDDRLQFEGLAGGELCLSPQWSSTRALLQLHSSPPSAAPLEPT